MVAKKNKDDNDWFVFFLIWAVLTALVCVLFSGCRPDEQVTNERGIKVIPNNDTDWEYVEWDGHEYVLWRPDPSHRGGIAHSPKCPCRSKND